MKSKQTKFILFIVCVVVLVGILGYVGKKNVKPGKLDAFAMELKNQGAEFYGAFWCPHCQEQKADFGTSKQYIPYIECSTAQKDQTQVCKDKKIEGYPTWYFKNGVTITSEDKQPIVCAPAPGIEGENAICAQIASTNGKKTFIFADHPSFSVKTMNDPIIEGNNWKFEIGSSTSGKVPLEILAQQIGFTLPQ
jgi:hypothetical protein